MAIAEQPVGPVLYGADAEAFRALVENLTPEMLRHAVVIVGDSGTAQDIVQQALIRIWRALDRLPASPGARRSYCFRTVIRLALDHVKTARRRRSHESVAAVRQQWQVEARTVDNPVARAAAREVWDCAMQLPERLRDVLVLHYGCGLTLRETAEVLDVPAGTVCTRQREGLDRLRTQMAAATGMAVPAIAGLVEHVLTIDGDGSPQPTTSIIRRLMEVSVMASTGNKVVGSIAAALLLAACAAVGWIIGNPLSSPDTVAPVGTSAPPSVPAVRPAQTQTPTASTTTETVEPSVQSGPGQRAASRPDTPPREPDPVAAALARAILTGRVVDTHRRPVAGCTVQMFAMPRRDPGGPFSYPAGARQLSAGALVDVRTDDDGRFETDVPPGQPLGIQVVAPDGLLPAGRNVEALEAGQRHDIGTIALASTGCIHGIVRDSAGNPVPGATVLLGILPAPGRAMRVVGPGGAGHHDAQATTNLRGEYELPGVSPGTHTVSATAEGRGQAQQTGSVVRSGERTRVDLTLSASELVVTVLGPDGRPVSGASVSLSTLPPGIQSENNRNPGWNAEPTSVTGADGRATVTPQHPSLTLIVRAGGHADYVRQIHVPTLNGTCEVRLLGGCRVIGRVVSTNGAPVPVAMVVLRSEDRTTADRLLPAADAQGRFTFDGVAPGPVRLLVVRPGPGTETAPRMAVAGQTLDFGDVALVGPARLVVRVTDETGKAVAGARVVVEPRFDGSGNSDGVSVMTGGGQMVSSLSGGPGGQGTTGADGTVAFDGLRVGSILGVRAERGGAPIGYADNVSVAPGETTCHLKLAAPGTIEGVLLGANGEPRPNVTLSALRDGYQQPVMSKTDAAGRFRIGNLSPGLWRLGVPWPSEDDPASSPATVVSAGRTRHVTLHLPGSFGWITVLDASGAPVEAATVEYGTRAPDDDGNWTLGLIHNSATTDADGRVPAASDDVRITTPAGSWLFSPGPAGCTIHLPDTGPGTLALSVTHDGGSAGASTVVAERTGPGELMWRASTSTTGPLSLDLPPGTYRISVTAPGMSTEIQTVSIETGVVTTTSAGLVPGGSLEVNLQASGATAYQPVTVVVRIAGDPGATRTQPAVAGGSAVFAGLRVGVAYALEVRIGDEVVAAGAVTIHADAVTRCDLPVADQDSVD